MRTYKYIQCNNTFYSKICAKEHKRGQCFGTVDKLLLLMAATHVGAPIQVLTLWLPVQLPAVIPWKVAEDGSNAWASAIHTGDSWALGLWLLRKWTNGLKIGLTLVAK